MTPTQSLYQASLPSGKHKQLHISLLLTAERIREYMNRICHAFGITLQQYNILRALHGAHPRALSCAEINSRMIQRSPDITRLLARLEELSLISRCRDIDDNRIVRTGIRQSGIDLLQAMDEMMSSVEDIFSTLSEEDCLHCQKSIEKVQNAVNERIATLPSALASCNVGCQSE